MPKAKFNIVVIGSGNMAFAMGRALAAKHTIVQVVSRNVKTGKQLAKVHGCVFNADIKDAHPNADFYLLCVPDDAIKKTSRKLKKVSGILVHHSGSRPLEELDTYHAKAVIWPFNSVNKQSLLNQKDVSLLYSADNASTLFMLNQLLAGLVCAKIEADDATRGRLHLAAVLVNNFTNHLYLQAAHITGNALPARKLLAGLAAQALQNLKDGKTLQKQTGPARRKDKGTLKNHLALLKNDATLSKIYVSLSQSIINTYSHE